MTKVDDGVLLCESKGWHTQPEVFWQDDEEDFLLGESTETVKDADGLYNVSSRITVAESHSTNFTCVIIDRNTNQFKEAYFIVPGCNLFKTFTILDLNA